MERVRVKVRMSYIDGQIAWGLPFLVRLQPQLGWQKIASELAVGKLVVIRDLNVPLNLPLVHVLKCALRTNCWFLIVRAIHVS